MVRQVRITQLVQAPPGQWVVYSSLTSVEGRTGEYPDGVELWAEPLEFYALIRANPDEDEPRDFATPMVRDYEIGYDLYPLDTVAGAVEVVRANGEADAINQVRGSRSFTLPKPRPTKEQ